MRGRRCGFGQARGGDVTAGMDASAHKDRNRRLAMDALIAAAAQTVKVSPLNE